MSTTATGIEWCDRTWNPVRGCSRISEGCRNCYAERVAARFSGTWATELDGQDVALDTRDAPGRSRSAPFRGFAEMRDGKARWTGKVALVPDALDAPLRWRKPARVFVNSMSDLFHEGLSDEAIAAVFGVMAAAPRHSFLVLTKRAERMRRWFEWVDTCPNEPGCGPGFVHPFSVLAREAAGHRLPISTEGLYLQRGGGPAPWPLPNVWLGVSVEDQATADARIPHLLATPAAIRFVSYEPALGPVDFYSPAAIACRTAPGGCTCGAHVTCLDGCPGPHPHPKPRGFLGLDWLIVGGESGPGARPFDVAWARSAVEQCRAAGVPVFVKQLGARPTFASGREAGKPPVPMATFAGALARSTYFRDRKGGDPAEWPEDLRVREWPS